MRGVVGQYGRPVRGDDGQEVSGNTEHDRTVGEGSAQQAQAVALIWRVQVVVVVVVIVVIVAVVIMVVIVNKTLN